MQTFDDDAVNAAAEQMWNEHAQDRTYAELSETEKDQMRSEARAVLEAAVRASTTRKSRRWYIMTLRHDGEIDNLLGPIEGGYEQADEIAKEWLKLKRMLVDHLDWSDINASCSFPLPAALRVEALSAEDFYALTGENWMCKYCETWFSPEDEDEEPPVCNKCREAGGE